MTSALALAAGCGGDDSSDKNSANPIDRGFASEMVAHHQSAIDMADVARDKGEHPQVRKLANDIVAAQQAEIRTLRSIDGELEGMNIGRGELGLDQHAMGMDTDMTQLESAKPFDRAFIEMMTLHHEGAITMARKELANGGYEPLRKVANDIIAAQSREIAQMRGWAANWYGQSQDGAGHTGGSDAGHM